MIDSLVPGGAEQSLAAVAPGYTNKGVQLDVAFLRDRTGLQNELLCAGANLFCLDGAGGRIGWFRRARRLVLERRPDLIHTTLADSNLIGRVAGDLARIPVVSSLVSLQYGPEQADDPNVWPLRMKLIQFANGLTARRVMRFHAVSEDVAEVMSRRLRIPRERIDVIPRGRDPIVLGSRTTERRTRARRLLGVDTKTALIVAIARHEHPKRLDLLIEALPLVMPELGKLRMVVAGREGGATGLLRSTAKRLGLEDEVQLLGARDDVPDLLCAADVLVLPSRREGFPGVLIEALALETPIVASDLPGVREVVGDDAACLVGSDRAADLAAAIVTTVRDERETRRRTAGGRARFEGRFTIEKVTDEMIAFYQRALDGASTRRHGRAPFKVA